MPLAGASQALVSNWQEHLKKKKKVARTPSNQKHMLCLFSRGDEDESVFCTETELFAVHRLALSY